MNLYFSKTAELAGVPEFIQIMRLGDHVAGEGKPFAVTPDDVTRLIAAFDAQTNDLAIDYEHLTFEKVESPAAGWIKELLDKGPEGLWARVEWTPRAAERIRQKEYRYFSPAFAAEKGADGKMHPARLLPCAITNFPAIDGMVPLAARQRDAGPNAAARLRGGESNHEKQEVKMKKLLQLLGLAEDATEDQAAEALTALKAKAETPQVKEAVPAALCKALDLKETASASEAEATVLALKQGQANAQAGEVRKLRQEIGAMKAERLVARAMEEGKVVAAQKLWAMEYAARDPEGFEVFAAKAPVVVPMDKAPTGPDKKAETAGDSVRLVAKFFGNSDEDLVKYGNHKNGE